MVEKNKVSIGVANEENREELGNYFDYVFIGDENYERKYKNEN